MGEILPIALGLVVGAAVTHGATGRPKLPWFVSGSVIAGALASWINGELSNAVWQLFVSFDALQAWLGAACYMAAVHAFRQASLAHQRRP
jgi:hypothetical protein